jgi:hypothetical protein
LFIALIGTIITAKTINMNHMRRFLSTAIPVFKALRPTPCNWHDYIIRTHDRQTAPTPREPDHEADLRPSCGHHAGIMRPIMTNRDQPWPSMAEHGRANHDQS